MDPSYPNQPIEVVGRAIEKKQFTDGNRVVGDRDWLKHLILSVKNVSNKNILAFDINVWIRKEGYMPTGVSIPMFFRTFTTSTDSNALNADGEKKIGTLRPGEVVKLRITDNNLSKFGAILKQYGVQDLERVKIEIPMVYYEDESRWSGGQESKPDPDNPEERIPINNVIGGSSESFSSWRVGFVPRNMGICGKLPLATIFPGVSPVFFCAKTSSSGSG